MTVSSGIAAAARAWFASPSDSAAERRLADALEQELARRVANDAGWPLPGRWFDGLSIEEYTPQTIRGFIWTVDQRRILIMVSFDADGSPISASLTMPDGKRFEVAW